MTDMTKRSVIFIDLLIDWILSHLFFVVGRLAWYVTPLWNQSGTSRPAGWLKIEQSDSQLSEDSFSKAEK